MMRNQALGMIETYGYVGAIEAADICLKAANVNLIGCEKVQGGLVTIHIRGDVAAVKAAIDAANIAVKKVGMLISSHVIPRPSRDVEKILPQPPSPEPELEKVKEEIIDEKYKKEELEKEIGKQEEDGKEEGRSEELEELIDKEIEVTEDDENEEDEDYEEGEDYEDDKGPSLIKTKNELERIKTVKLRTLARRLEDRYEIPFPIERNQIKYAKKGELIEAITKYYERVK